MTSFGSRSILSRRRRLLLTLSAVGLLATLAPPSAPGGSGVVNTDGTIDITLNLRFPPTPDMLTEIRQQVTDASHVLWDASEGQLRFGTVTLTCGPVNEDLADMWVFPQSGRAGVGFWCDGSGLGRAGSHVTQFLPSSTGIVLAHEFGHLALGLGDEYSEQSRFGACWGYGPCMEAADLSEANQCLMQQPGGFSQTELCTAGGHDPLQGDGLSCAAQPVPHGCTDNCEFFNHTTNRYETTQETALCGSTGCWPHLTTNFSFLTAPAGLPAIAEPGGFVDPTFVDNCDATDTVLLVLDASESMNWSVSTSNAEVCGDGIDNDLDGMVDEGDCQQSRLSYLQAAARGWLGLANNQGVRAGIVSFNCNPHLEAPFQEVDGTTIGGLRGAVDGLTAGGGTAIGRALSSSTLLFGAESGALNKTAFLISDGHNTCGEDPAAVVGALNAEGIRVYTLSTGEASDSTLLSDIAGETGGARLDQRDASALVGSFVQMWSRYRNGGVIIPLMPYQLDSRGQTGEFPRENDRTTTDWVKNREIIRKPIPRNNLFRVEAEEGTEVLSIALAGNHANMTTFGVEAMLEGPAGPAPDTFDSRVPDPLLRVVRDPYFLLLELRKPNPGTWYVSVEPRAGAGRIQTGNITVITDNPRADLFASLDRHIVNDPSRPVELRVIPYYDTTLMSVDVLEANLVAPDGSTSPIPLVENDLAGGGYLGDIVSMPFEGIYEVRVLMRTGPKTYNDPGESIWADLGPENSVPVPVFERATTLYFYVTKGEKVCRSRNPEDCDGDGIQDESDTDDRDGDGIPDSCDPDSDNDERPDRAEWRGEPTDLDGDKITDHLDDDADGDGIPDAEDPDPMSGRPTHEVRLPDGEIGPPCEEPRCYYVSVSSSEPVSGVTVGLGWEVADRLEVVEILPGPDIPEKQIQFFNANVEGRGLSLGQALVGMALQPGVSIGPGRDLRVLKLLVRARESVKPGTQVKMCFLDGIGEPAQDTILSITRGDGVVSVEPRKDDCGTLVATGDTSPPRLRCPGDILVPCPGKEGSIVEYEVQATDDCGDARVECEPPSGSRFPVGVTIVRCRAEDDSGNVSFCYFRVIVADTLPPRLSCPEGEIVVDCGGPNGSTVEYEVEATDDCGDVAVRCEPPSGSSFPPGTTVVTCTAIDEAGNRAVCRFRVTVRPGECFRRGDSNSDNRLDISDGILDLNHLFLGARRPDCMDAADFDDNGKLDITDAIAKFSYLFQGGRPPAPPGVEACGSDPTPDDLPVCEAACE